MRSGPAEAVGTIDFPVKILFVMRHPAAVRSLDSVLRMLDAAGHHVHLAFGGIKPEAHKVLQQLADGCEHLTFGGLPGRGSPGWSKDDAGWNVLARRLRNDTDYLRYLEPSYADAPALRDRAKKNAHPLTKRAAKVAGLGGAPTVRALRHTLDHAERCLEPPPHVAPLPRGLRARRRGRHPPRARLRPGRLRPRREAARASTPSTRSSAGTT